MQLPYTQKDKINNISFFLFFLFYFAHSNVSIFIPQTFVLFLKENIANISRFHHSFSSIHRYLSLYLPFLNWLGASVWFLFIWFLLHVVQQQKDFCTDNEKFQCLSSEKNSLLFLFFQKEWTNIISEHQSYTGVTFYRSYLPSAK